MEFEITRLRSKEIEKQEAFLQPKQEPRARRVQPIASQAFAFVSQTIEPTNQFVRERSLSPCRNRDFRCGSTCSHQFNVQVFRPDTQQKSLPKACWRRESCCAEAAPFWLLVTTTRRRMAMQSLPYEAPWEREREGGQANMFAKPLIAHVPRKGRSTR